MGDRVRVQFPVPDIYSVCNKLAIQGQLSLPSLRVGKWVPASAGKAKAGMVHSVSGWTRGVQVKLWDPLRTRAIPECLRGVITTRRYTNPRLPYLTLPYLTSHQATLFVHKVCHACVGIGVARILSGVNFFLKKVDDLFSRRPQKTF